MSWFSGIDFPSNNLFTFLLSVRNYLERQESPSAKSCEFDGFLEWYISYIFRLIPFYIFRSFRRITVICIDIHSFHRLTLYHIFNSIFWVLIFSLLFPSLDSLLHISLFLPYSVYTSLFLRFTVYIYTPLAICSKFFHSFFVTVFTFSLFLRFIVYIFITLVVCSKIFHSFFVLYFSLNPPFDRVLNFHSFRRFVIYKSCLLCSQFRYVSLIPEFADDMGICYKNINLGYGLDDRGSRVRSQRGLGIFLFNTASRTALGPGQPPMQWVPGALSLEVKRPGRKADHSPPTSAEVKEWAELYLHSPNTPSWRGSQLKWKSTVTTLPLPLIKALKSLCPTVDAGHIKSIRVNLTSP
jgi:hypothetical protein